MFIKSFGWKNYGFRFINESMPKMETKQQHLTIDCSAINILSRFRLNLMSSHNMKIIIWFDRSTKNKHSARTKRAISKSVPIHRSMVFTFKWRFLLLPTQKTRTPKMNFRFEWEREKDTCTLLLFCIKTHIFDVTPFNSFNTIKIDVINIK